jgi:hypothetical protein
MAVPKTAITAPVPTASHANFLRLGGIAFFNVLACSCCAEFTGAPLDWHDEKSTAAADMNHRQPSLMRLMIGIIIEEVNMLTVIQRALKKEFRGWGSLAWGILWVILWKATGNRASALHAAIPAPGQSNAPVPVPFEWDARRALP